MEVIIRCGPDVALLASGWFLLMLHDRDWRLRGIQLSKLQSAADIFVVLVSSLVLFDVRGQVGVDHADAGVVKQKADCHSSLVTLTKKNKNTFSHITSELVITKKRKKKSSDAPSRWASFMLSCFSGSLLQTIINTSCCVITADHLLFTE